mgnify:FL=1
MSNPWAGFLEDEPESAYFSYTGQFGGPGKSQKQENYYLDQFTDIYNQYLGRLGAQVRGGEVPTEQWQDYLGGFNWDDWYRQREPYEARQAGYSGFVPQATWQVGPKYGM